MDRQAADVKRGFGVIRVSNDRLMAFVVRLVKENVPFTIAYGTDAAYVEDYEPGKRTGIRQAVPGGVREDRRPATRP